MDLKNREINCYIVGCYYPSLIRKASYNLLIFLELSAIRYWNWDSCIFIDSMICCFIVFRRSINSLFGVLSLFSEKRYWLLLRLFWSQWLGGSCCVAILLCFWDSWEFACGRRTLFTGKLFALGLCFATDDLIVFMRAFSRVLFLIDSCFFRLFANLMKGGLVTVNAV